MEIDLEILKLSYRETKNINLDNPHPELVPSIPDINQSNFLLDLFSSQINRKSFDNSTPKDFSFGQTNNFFAKTGLAPVSTLEARQSKQVSLSTENSKLHINSIKKIDEYENPSVSDDSNNLLNVGSLKIQTNMAAENQVFQSQKNQNFPRRTKLPDKSSNDAPFFLSSHENSKSDSIKKDFGSPADVVKLTQKPFSSQNPNLFKRTNTLEDDRRKRIIELKDQLIQKEREIDHLMEEMKHQLEKQKSAKTISGSDLLLSREAIFKMRIEQKENELRILMQDLEDSRKKSQNSNYQNHRNHFNHESIPQNNFSLIESNELESFSSGKTFSYKLEQQPPRNQNTKGHLDQNNLTATNYRIQNQKPNLNAN